MVDTASLQKYSLFGALLPEEIDRVRPLMGSATFAAGEYVIREECPNDSIYFVLEGRVEVSKHGVRLVEIGEGETFGEMELLDVMPSVASIRTLTPCSFATISNRAIHEIFHLDTRIFSIIIMNLARDLSRRLRHMDDVASVIIKPPRSCPD
jgi:CRP-like cAMP-binding protein